MKTKFLIAFLFLSLFCKAHPNYYHWDPQILNTGAPQSTMNGMQFGDGNVYYANPSGLITRAYLSGTTWLYENITGITPVKYGSVFSYGDWKLYYIGTDNKVHNLYKSGSVWMSPVMQSASAPARGDGLLFTDNSTLFYVSTGNMLCKLQWYGSSWVYTAYPGVLVKTNTVLAYGDWKLYFVDNQSKLRNMMQNGSGAWYDAGVISGAGALVRGDGIAFGAPGELFYIDITDNITRLSWNGTTWLAEAIKLRAPCIWNYFSPNLIYDQGRLFYTNSASVPTLLMKDVCQWYEKPLNNMSTAAPYRFTFGGGRLFGTYGNQLCRFEPSIDVNNYPYVYLKGRTFYKNNNTPMYPMVMNYLVNLYTDDNVNYWVGPHHSFFPDNQRNSTNQATGTAAMNAHFAQIAAMGCNAIRVMGTAVTENAQTPTNYLPAVATKYTTNLIDVAQPVDAAFELKLFPLIKEVLDAANANGLKVIFVTGQGTLTNPTHSAGYINYLNNLSSYVPVNTHQGLLAYDVYNEPGLNYAVSDKVQICNLSYSMFTTIRANDPNHLITIGTFGGDDLARWDPAILSCDFYSFHFYPYTTYTDVSFQSELAKMYWCKENINDRPWIMGETGFSSEEKYMPFGSNPGQDLCTGWPYGINGWGTEAVQQNYCSLTENWTRGSGGSGYSWWAYHDVYHAGPLDPNYRENFFGAISNCDRWKAVTGEFNKNFLNATLYPCDNATKPSDFYYYNRDVTRSHKLTGVLLDQWGQPIKDGLVGSWNSSWGNYVSTYSKSDGSFELWTNYPAEYVIFTALGKKVEGMTGVSSSYVSNVGNVGNVTINQMPSCQMPIGHIRMAPTEQANVKMEAYPNPTDGNITLQLSTEDEYRITLYNMVGEVVREQTFTGAQLNIDLSDQPVGVYTLHVTNLSGTFAETTRVIRN